MNKNDEEIIKFHSYLVKPLLEDMQTLLYGSMASGGLDFFTGVDLKEDLEKIKTICPLLSSGAIKEFDTLFQLSYQLEKTIRRASSESERKILKEFQDLTSDKRKDLQVELTPKHSKLSELLQLPHGPLF